MDKHEIALASLLNEMILYDPLCSVVAMGSIGRGDYRIDSDIDIIVITWLHATLTDSIAWDSLRTIVQWNEVRLDEGLRNDMKYHVQACSPMNYQNMIMRGPIWRWGSSRILYDPSGIAHWGESRIIQFYKDNEELDIKNRRFHEQYTKWKSDKSSQRQYETQDAFVQSCDLSKVIISYSSFSAISKMTEICLKAEGRAAAADNQKS